VFSSANSSSFGSAASPLVQPVLGDPVVRGVVAALKRFSSSPAVVEAALPYLGTAVQSGPRGGERHYGQAISESEETTALLTSRSQATTSLNRAPQRPDVRR